MTLPQNTGRASGSWDCADPVRPCWWRQPHTGLLAGVVTANMALVYPVTAVLVGGGSQSLAYLAVGCLAGQLFLLGLWLGYGGLHFTARFAIVLPLTVFGTWLAALGLVSGVDYTLLLVGTSALMVLAMHAALLPLRALLGWRVDFDPAYHPRSTDRKLQLRLIHWLAFMAACALPCAVPQFLPPELREQALLIAAALGSLALCTAAPVAYLTLVARRSRRAWSFALCAIAVAVIVSNFLFGPMLGSEGPTVLLANVSVAATVFANLSVLRQLGGLRLFSVLPGTAWSPAMIDLSTISDPELAYLISVWARLPADFRRAVAALVRAADDMSCHRRVEREPANPAASHLVPEGAETCSV